MSKINKTHLIILLLINTFIVGKLIHFSWTGNDKAIIAVIFYYFVLLLLNLFIWVILDYFKRPVGNVYKISTTVLVILILPVLLLGIIH
nr:hypothetical protein [uncultured Fluviicola sp.]